MKLSDEQRQALTDADAHLALARSALKSVKSSPAIRAGLEIVKLRIYVQRVLKED